jgi:biopolymer transport protein ExbB/TolQ
VQELLGSARYGEAAALAAELRGSHLAQVLGPAIREYLRATPAGSANPGGPGKPEAIAAAARSLERGSARAVANLRRGLGGLATIGSTAPFVGLLGTVAGIISAFQAMAGGSVGLGSVSAGIAEALVTTAFGLLVAIPSVMMFNALSGRVETMEVDLEEAAAELIDLFSKQGASDAAGPG